VVIAVNYIDYGLGVLKVVSPHFPKTLLATNIPHCKSYIFVGHFFNIKANCWNRCQLFPKFQLVEDGGLSGGIETNHEDSHFLIEGEKSAPYFGY
jgi:hypothetical protein